MTEIIRSFEIPTLLFDLLSKLLRERDLFLCLTIVKLRQANKEDATYHKEDR